MKYAREGEWKFTMGYVYSYRMAAKTTEKQKKLIKCIEQITKNFNEESFSDGKNIELIDVQKWGVLIQISTIKPFKSPIKAVQGWTRALTNFVEPNNNGAQVFKYYPMFDHEKKLFSAYNSSNLLAAVLAIYNDFDNQYELSDMLWAYLNACAPAKIDALVEKGDKIRQAYTQQQKEVKS